MQTVRGCPKHCSFCSVWRTDGQKPRQRSFEKVINEIIDLRRLGFRFIALADDNFYPVTLTDLRLAREQGNAERLQSLLDTRSERFALTAELAKLPKDMVFFTQITMESAEDGEYLDAMRRANIKGALVGVEAVTPEGLKAVYKDFNYSGDRLVEQLQIFRKHGLHVLGSFIFGLPTDKPSTFDATIDVAIRAERSLARWLRAPPDIDGSDLSCGSAALQLRSLQQILQGLPGYWWDNYPWGRQRRQHRQRSGNRRQAVEDMVH